MMLFGTAARSPINSGSIVAFFVIATMVASTTLVTAAAKWNANSNGFSTSAQLRKMRPLPTNIASAAVMLSAWPPAVTLGSVPFSSVVFDGTLVWLVPFSATHVVCIDPSNGDAMTAVALPQAASNPTNKFYSAVYDGEGTIWVPPDASGYFMTINVIARTTATLTHPSLGSSAFYVGATFDGDYVWCAPYKPGVILRIDRRLKQGTPVMSAPFMGATVLYYFAAVIFDGMRVWFAPSQATNVLAIDVASLSASSLSNWPPGVWRGGGASNFIGGCFDGARVWLAPQDALAVAYIDVSSMVILSLPLPTITAMGGSAFCTAFFDGSRVWLMPYQADSFVVIDPRGTPLPTWVAYRTVVTMRGCGGASDGHHFYVAPITSSAAAVMKIPLGSVMSASETATRSGSFSPTLSVKASATLTGPRVSRSLSIAVTDTLKPSPTLPTTSGTMLSNTASPSDANRSRSTSRVTSRSPSAVASATGATASSFTASQPSASVSPARTDRSITGSDTGSITGTCTGTSTARISTTAGTASPSLTSYVEGDLRRVVVPVVALTASQAMVAMSLFGVSPTSATSSGRLAALVRILQCSASGGADRDDGGDVLPGTSHPLRVSVVAAAHDGPASAGRLRQNAGMVAGNLGMSVSLVAIHAAVVCGVRMRWSGGAGVAAWQLAMAAARFPSLVLPGQLYLLTLVPQGGVALVSSGASTGSGVAIGVVGLTLCAAANLALWAWVFATTRQRVKAVPLSSAAPPRWYEAWLRVESEWELLDASSFGGGSTVKYLRAYGSYFEDFTERAAWWAAFELVVANASSVAGGLADAIGCAWASWLNVAPYVVYLVVLLWLRPHQRRMDFATAGVINLLLLVGAVCAALAASGVAVSPKMAEAVAAFASVSTGFVSVMTLLVSPVIVVRRRVAEQLRRRREQTSMNAASSSLPMLDWAAAASLRPVACHHHHHDAPPPAPGGGIELRDEPTMSVSSRRDASLPTIVSAEEVGPPTSRGAAAFALRRTAEGQALFEELEALLTNDGPSSPSQPRWVPREEPAASNKEAPNIFTDFLHDLR